MLAKGLRVRGRVHGKGDLRIEADIEGDVVVNGGLEVDVPGSVTGGLEAESVTVSGSVAGDVTASGAVTITQSGSVQGNIVASELSLEEGGRFIGEINAEFDLPDAIR